MCRASVRLNLWNSCSHHEYFSHWSSISYGPKQRNLQSLKLGHPLLCSPVRPKIFFAFLFYCQRYWKNNRDLSDKDWALKTFFFKHCYFSYVCSGERLQYSLCWILWYGNCRYFLRYSDKILDPASIRCFFKLSCFCRWKGAFWESKFVVLKPFIKE